VDGMAKILIADDSSMMRKIAKMSLEKGGYTVVEAQDGAEAVNLVKQEMPDVVLLDAEMPEMDGWEACKAIKQDAQTANIPVLMCTGHDLSEEPEQLTESGANGYVVKPYNAALLLEKVAGVLHG
jgi:CheY-like chemotaxis protein